MAILTDLPDELLLFIIADVSPLYIDSFVLTCKRIYELRTDVYREHDIIRSKLPTSFARPQYMDLLRNIFQNPGLALYPVSWQFHTHDTGDKGAPEDVVDEINTQILQGPHTALLRTKDCRFNAQDLVNPLLITRLLNIRKIAICSHWQPSLLKTVSRIVEASYDPALSLKEPLPLGKLTEAHVHVFRKDNYGMELAILLAMIPTLKKLQVHSLTSLNPYSRQHQHHCSGVTNILLNECAHSSFLIELISLTTTLQKFTYTHRYDGDGPVAELESRRLAQLLKERAGHSLLYLDLLTFPPGSLLGVCQDQYPNYNDLSIGPLREFSVLRVLVTCVDVFIKRRGHSEFENGTGTVQRLVAWLPASLEALVLHPGLHEWDKDVLRMLFRGLRNKKQARIPHLKRINFVKFPDFDQLMPDDIKRVCRETGVKLGYTLHSCKYHDCGEPLKQLREWEGRPWVEALGKCCYPEDWR